MAHKFLVSRVLTALVGVGLSACGGGGGDAPAATGSTGSVNPTTCTGGSRVTISGRVRFEKPPFRESGGLDLDNPQLKPARQVLVEIICVGNNAILGSTNTDDLGDYSMRVSTGGPMFIRVRAIMARTGDPSWRVRVLDNTADDALWAVSGDSFSPTQDDSRNVFIKTGWDGTRYTSERAAAPFAILDAIYSAMLKVLGERSGAKFPVLDAHWSPDNSASEEFDPQNGDIITTFYSNGNIFVLGEENVDTDEFDGHVITHEWGHYFEDVFSRADSRGGPHALGDVLDPRVAFSEGWGNAFSAIAIGNSVYKDSFDTAQAAHFLFDVDDNLNFNAGFWSEGSSQSIIYDAFDSPADDDDGVGLGFGPVFDAMITAQRNTTALTTIFPFVDHLVTEFPEQKTALDNLVVAQDMNPVTSKFGDSQTNDAGAGGKVIPIYKDLAVGATPTNVCSTNQFGEPNKLGSTQYVRFMPLEEGEHTITVKLFPTIGIPDSDPDFELYRVGFVTEGIENSANQSADNPGGDGTHTEVKQVNLVTGKRYILVVSEFLNADEEFFFGEKTGDTGGDNVCFDVTVTKS